MRVIGKEEDRRGGGRCSRGQNTITHNKDGDLAVVCYGKARGRFK